MYINSPLKEYLDDLAARKSAPGGGSAAALTAATGTSLMMMVANFTIGKAEYKDVEAKAADILLRTQKADAELRNLIDEDVEAYKRSVAGLKGLSEDDARADELYKGAMEPPFIICELAYKCMQICRELADIGNKNLITDTAIAAVLFDAAFFAAKFNVYINLKYIKDTDYIAKIHHVLSQIEEKIPVLKEEIMEVCEDAISK